MTDRNEHPGVGTGSVACERRFDIAVYLLGGLSEAESRTLRAHIDSCAWCTMELRSLRPVSDLVSAADMRSVELQLGDRADTGPEPGLMSRILERAEAELGSVSPTIDLTAARAAKMPSPRRQVRSRWLSAAAAVALFVLGGGSVLGAQRVLDHPKPSITGESVRFATVSLTSGTPAITDAAARPKAWAWVGETPAGTYATLYTQNLQAGQVYKWWFERKDGSRVGLGSFRYPSGQQTWLICPGSTSEPRAQLVAIGATDATGHEVLRTTLPPPPVLRRA